MKKILFSIFAHPDDEGFGPSGTLIKEVKNGTDLYLLCATRGDAGRNVDNYEDLGKVREEEWWKAGKLIGAKGVKQLGYKDGCLCNAMYHEIAGKIQKYVEGTVQSYDEPVETHFMTFDPTGLSGHLDHIAMSHISVYVFLKLQEAHKDWHFGKLRYFCIPRNGKLANDTSYLYMPPGRRKNEIDEIIDVSDVYEEKLAVMHTHYSQRDDMNWILSIHGDAIKTEQFRYLK